MGGVFLEENFIVSDNNSVGQRIDKYLANLFDGKSRSFIQNIIENENILVNNKKVKASYKLKECDKIYLNIPEPKELEIEAENINLNIVYQDDDVAIINKPQGMVVHPAPGNYTGTLVNGLLYHLNDLSGINGVIRPGIVHRIDKDTSGLLVIAKNDLAHNELAKQFKDHSIKREYYALVEGVIKENEGTINKPLGRHPVERTKISVIKDGRHAVTHYSVIERYKKNTLIKCVLETGRTHQIRVHMSSIGYPLVGDPVYGYKKQRFKLAGQVLHAKTLGFIHPRRKVYVEFDSDLPVEFEKILNILKKDI